MDLEEELSLFQQEEAVNGHLDPPIQSKTFDEKESEDLLGLNQTIKLSSRAKVAKIDNERIFNKQKGLNYVIRNHPRLIRVFHKNDKALEKKLLFKKSSLNSKTSRQLKYENEYNNLSSILQFYQLWCHGLFPKAKFKDCLLLLRGFGTRSSQLKIYRRELIEQQLRKLKESKGILDGTEDHTRNQEMQNEAEDYSSNDKTREAEENVDDDDWSFMNANQSNGLFVGDDDDLYHTPSGLNINEIRKDHKSFENTNLTVPHETELEVQAPHNSNDSDDPFSDDDTPIEQDSMQKNEEYPNTQEMDMNTDGQEYEDELEVMREMGL